MWTTYVQFRKQIVKTTFGCEQCPSFAIFFTSTSILSYIFSYQYISITIIVTTIARILCFSWKSHLPSSAVAPNGCCYKFLQTNRPKEKTELICSSCSNKPHYDRAIQGIWVVVQFIRVKLSGEIQNKNKTTQKKKNEKKLLIARTSR